MDDLLPSKQDLDWRRTKPFFLGGRNNNGGQESWGFGQDRHKNIDLVQAEKSFYQSMLKFCAKLYHHLKSQGACCSVKSFPGCCCKLIFCALAGCAFGGLGGWLSEADAKYGLAIDQARPAYSLNVINTLKRWQPGRNNLPRRVSVLLHWLGQHLSKYWVWETEPIKLVLKRKVGEHVFIKIFWSDLLDGFGNFWVHGGQNGVLFCKFCIKICRLFPVLLQGDKWVDKCFLTLRGRDLQILAWREASLFFLQAPSIWRPWRTDGAWLHPLLHGPEWWMW